MSRLLDVYPQSNLKWRIKRENKGLKMNCPWRKNVSCPDFVSWKECGELKAWLPDDMFHSSSRTADKFAEEYDRHGDSYTQNATSESLKKVFDNVQGNVSTQELDGLTDSKRLYIWLQWLSTGPRKVGANGKVLRSWPTCYKAKYFPTLYLCFKASLRADDLICMKKNL